MKPNTATKSPNKSEVAPAPRGTQGWGVVRIIAGVIHWWSKKDTWSSDPMDCRQWQERESAYACAQSMRGLLVAGCGLVEVEVNDWRMAPTRQLEDMARQAEAIAR